MLKSFVFSLLVYVVSVASVLAQMKSGSEMKNYSSIFRLSDAASAHFSVTYQGCDSPANILFPGEQPEFSFQIKNTTNQPLTADGNAELVPFGTKGIAGDIWTPEVYANGDPKSTPIHLEIPAGGTQDLKLKFDVPKQFGGYAIVFDMGANGRLFGTSLARTYPPSSEDIPYPKMLLDAGVGLNALNRLGVRSVRKEWGFNPDNPAAADQLDKVMKDYSAHHITALIVWEAGDTSKQPLGTIARHWLGDDDVMLDFMGNGDRVWLPEQDEKFRQAVAEATAKYGWPRGPITGVSLWNEPWEGISISGWQADLPRYRELYAQMAKGVEDARKQGAQVLVVGCDSSTNSWDKLFSDGKDAYLPWFDACTIHYQGIAAPSLYKMWLNRKGPNGRVQIWDTESWVANTDDRVATIVATDRAAGYDRGMGVFWGDVTSPISDNASNAWPLCASVGAVQHFIGERTFKELLFQKGLPWIFVFDGLKGNADDGSVVISGDLGEVLGENAFPLRSVRGLKEMQEKEDLRTKLAALPADSPDRADLQKRLDEPTVLSGGMLTMPAIPFAQAYDFYGNPLPLADGQIKIPLDFRGYYLKTDGTPGSFAKLLDALRAARIDGYEPLDVVMHDALKPFSEGGTFKLTLTNILNRPIQGNFQATIPGLKIDAPTTVSFAPFETKEVLLQVSGAPRDDNSYPLRMVFDAGVDGKAIDEETLHVNQIARRTINVDGDLTDWKGVLPQGVVAKGKGAPTLTEAAWLPFKEFAHDLKAGVATAYMAHDDRYFYFAAKIADDSHDDGTFRFETLDPDQFFYPAVSYEINKEHQLTPLETNFTPLAVTDALRLSATSPDTRDSKIWSSGKFAGLGFALQAPPDKASQVAIHLIDPPGESGHDGITVQIVDQQSGKILLRKEVESSPTGVYVVFNIKGQVHFTIRGGKDSSVAVGGIFLDPPAADNLTVDAPAQFVKLDADTLGNWPDKYGKRGQWLPGNPAQFPGDTTIVGGPLVEHDWPADVRRFTYRKDASLPSGNYPNLDNVQIAFNVLPQDEKITIANPPGTMPNFVPGQDTDYEFALNQVAKKYGGGTEIWRMRVPGMPSKNFYAREPKSPQDGPVRGGKLVVRYEGNTRIVEAAIPWSEIPEVKSAADAGKPVKFTFRINDNKGVGMELAEDRSVSKINPHTFHAEWVQHWSNEVEFGFGK